MEIEFEATFPNIDKKEIRARLKKAGAHLVRPEFMQKRNVFDLPKSNEIPGGWLRVRDEGNKITLSLKIIDGDKISDQKETCLEVNDFKDASFFLEKIGCEKKAYQESKRELWILDRVELTIDEWPHLEPFLEVEALSEEAVKNACQKLELDYSGALFGSISELYAKRYGVSREVINNDIKELLFDSKNPFE